jgi:hypothetical protein
MYIMGDHYSVLALRGYMRSSIQHVYLVWIYPYGSLSLYVLPFKKCYGDWKMGVSLGRLLSVKWLQTMYCLVEHIKTLPRQQESAHSCVVTR